MELPLPEGDRKVTWRAVQAGRIQTPSGFLLLPDWMCLPITCSSDESKKKNKIILIENFELAIMRPHLEIHYMSLLYISASI